MPEGPLTRPLRVDLSAEGGGEGRIPLTLEFLLNEEIPVPLPQGERGKPVDVERMHTGRQQSCAG